MNVKGINPMTLFSKINTKVAKINKITSGVFLTIILNFKFITKGETISETSLQLISPWDPMSTMKLRL